VSVLLNHCEPFQFEGLAERNKNKKKAFGGIIVEIGESRNNMLQYFTQCLTFA